MAYKSIIAPKSIDLLQLIFKIQNPQKKDCNARTAN